MSADAGQLRALADLVVAVGSNVQPGQLVGVGARVGQEALAREVAASAYRRGAKFVDVSYFDPHVKKARLELAVEETLGFVPDWYGDRVLAIGDARGALIGLGGPLDPRLFEGIEPARAAQDRLPFLKELPRLVNERTVNWTQVPCPTPEWARLVFPDLPGDAPLERLWEAIFHVCRIDEADPVAAWEARLDTLGERARRLAELDLDRLRLVGPGTDLTIGLFHGARWEAARFTTVDGIVHAPNLPTEEVFTTPDPIRTEGVVRATRPLDLQGAVVEGLELRFAEGRIVGVEATSGADVARARVGVDEGAARLGEIALVDRDSRVGSLGLVFRETQLDENAATHLAFGNGFDFLVPEAERELVNRSDVHYDVVVGGDEVTVTGVTTGGEEVALLRQGEWQD
jgi:aminopeptidase